MLTNPGGQPKLSGYVLHRRGAQHDNPNSGIQNFLALWAFLCWAFGALCMLLRVIFPGEPAEDFPRIVRIVDAGKVVHYYSEVKRNGVFCRLSARNIGVIGYIRGLFFELLAIAQATH